MPRGLGRRNRHDEADGDTMISEPVPRPTSGAPTHKACGACRGVNAMQAMTCQICGMQFSTTVRSGRFSRLIRTTRPALEPVEDDDIVVIDDPVADDLVARLSEALLPKDAR